MRTMILLILVLLMSAGIAWERVVMHKRTSNIAYRAGRSGWSKYENATGTARPTSH